jgi:2-dehydro-3-deoxyphosphogluconate aldolase/(4S)-4-hydroxy-2-oxoglutarate aldolase
MTADAVRRAVEDGKLIAILRLDELEQAESLVRALLDGGVRAVELTMTNPQSPAVVRHLLQVVPAFKNGDCAIGLGSVRNDQEATVAIESGAQFLVSPIVLPRVIESAVRQSIPILPGALTPTEMQQAWDAGATWVKCFPARWIGPEGIREVLAPLPYLKLVPTGGILVGNVADYLAAGASAVGVGSALIDRQALRNQDWHGVANAAARFVAATREQR